MRPPEAAIRLTEAGLCVFPINADREPIVKGWRFGAASNADEVARMWHGVTGAAGIGLAPAQSGIVAIDFDRHKGSDATLGRWLMDHGDDFQKTVTNRTPHGGRHYLYRAGTARIAFTVGKIAPGLDTMAYGGGYLALPDTVTADGTYFWAEGCSPWEIDPAPLPEWLLPILPKHREGTQERKRGPSPNTVLGLGPPPPLPGPLSADVLRFVVRDPLYSCYLAAFVGVPVAEGKRFSSIVRDDAHPSAALFRKEDGALWFHDFAASGRDEGWLTLAELYAATITGEVVKVVTTVDGVRYPSPAHATWLRRLCVDAKIARPASVPMRPLPASATTGVRRVYDGVKLLYGCRWLGEAGAPAVLARRFLAGWVGVTPRTAEHGVKMLVEWGILAEAGTHPARYGKQQSLYLPVPPSGSQIEAGKIGKTLAMVTDLSDASKRPYWLDRPEKEQQQHGNDNDPRQLPFNLADARAD
jgi:hypothetical protein